jgi:Homeodomain-like domain
VASELKPAAKRLVEEMQTRLGLNSVDARRAAFVVLAVATGWKNARIARYLGVSRARVGQRVARYERYALTNAKAYPQIAKVLKRRPKRPDKEGAIQIGFPRTEWNDPAFAVDMLNRLV